MEIEAKYAIGDPATFERLRQGEPAGRYRFVFLSEHDADDVYFDTASRQLMQAGWVLRVREGVQPGRAAVTLKSRGRARGAIHRREEIETIVPAGTPPAAWPASALLRKVHELTGGAPLVEALRLRQHRVLHDVRRAKRTVAVRFLDEVVFQAGSRAETSLEMEVELSAAGSLEDLHALDELLRADHVKPQARSKFERALEWAGGANGAMDPKPKRAAAAVTDPAHSVAVAAATAAAPVGPPAAAPATAPTAAPAPKSKPQFDAATDVVEAGRRVLAFHAHRMLANEPGARAGDAEALHDMRVAIRRQRSLLRILSPWLRRKPLRRARNELRETGVALGSVRDLDVLLEAAGEYSAGRRQGRIAALQPLLTAWNHDRNAARAVLLERLDATAWKKFCVRYDEFLEGGVDIRRAGIDVAHPERAAEREPSRIAHVLPAAVWSHYATLRAYDEGLESASFETLHRARVETKRLRYLLEFFRPALDPRTQEAIETLVAVQDHLGAINDAHVAAARVRAFLENASASGPLRTLIAVRGYLEHLTQDRDRRRAEFAPLWARVTGAEFKQLLAHTCAVL